MMDPLFRGEIKIVFNYSEGSAARRGAKNFENPGQVSSLRAKRDATELLHIIFIKCRNENTVVFDDCYEPGMLTAPGN